MGESAMERLQRCAEQAKRDRARAAEHWNLLVKIGHENEQLRAALTEYFGSLELAYEALGIIAGKERR